MEHCAGSQESGVSAADVCLQQWRGDVVQRPRRTALESRCLELHWQVTGCGRRQHDQRLAADRYDLGRSAADVFKLPLLCVYIYPMRAPGHNAPLIHLLILVLYMYCLLVYLASPTYFLFSLLIFLIYFLFL